MSRHKQLTIGLFGFGVVGEGIFRVLEQTPSLNAGIKKICIRHAEKERNADPSFFTTDASLILDDPEINVVVELIDDADEAYRIVKKALSNGKAVVSANKKMIATHLAELVWLQQLHNLPFLYEGAVCGSIPILRNLEEYYDNDLLQSIAGIVNGSTNYILTSIAAGASYQQALQEAQQLGFAESDPRLDVEGYDAANKLAILLAHAYGIVSDAGSLLRKGIQHLQSFDAGFASEKNYRIKLVAKACKLASGKVAAWVLPQFVSGESQLYHVNQEYNGVTLESKLADKQFLYGKGAGRYPTASAVISDLSALSYDYRYEYKKLHRPEQFSLTSDFFLRVYVSFDSWAQVNKWDFEEVTSFHGTSDRQYITGIIHAEKLQQADWYHEASVSIIVLPDGLVEKEALVTRQLKKLSLQLAGIN